MSDTPETDAKEKETVHRPIEEHAHYGWKTARSLERRLSQAQAKLKQCEADLKRIRTNA